MLENPSGRVPQALEAAKMILEERSKNQSPVLNPMEERQLAKLENSQAHLSEEQKDEKLHISFSLRAVASFLILHGLLALEPFGNLFNISWDIQYTVAYVLLIVIASSSIFGGIAIFLKQKLGLWSGSLAMLLTIPYFQLGSVAFFNAGLTTILIQVYPPLHLNFYLFANNISMKWGITGAESFFAVNIVGFLGFGVLQMALDFLNEKKEWPSHLH